MSRPKGEGQGSVDGSLRQVEVSPERLPGWVERFCARHPGTIVSGEVDNPGTLVLSAPDEAWARVLEAGLPSPVGVILIRRKGYAVGAGDAHDWTVSKVGTRHIQGRTAAGGWSQQRFARRRSNATSALVSDVIEHVVQRLPASLGVRSLAVGGDRAMVVEVLDDPRLKHLSVLPRREFYDLPDPTRQVLQQALDRGLAIRIEIHDPSRADDAQGERMSTDDAPG